MGDSVENGTAGFEAILTQDELDYLQLKMPKGFALVATPRIAAVVSKAPKVTTSTSNQRSIGAHHTEGGEQDSAWTGGSKIPRGLPKESKVVINTALVGSNIPTMGGVLQTSSTGVTTRPTNKQPSAVSELMKKCQMVLKKMQAHNSAGPFLEPVDPKALNIPDYPLIVKEPMDLSTVEKKLKDGLYANPAAFGADMRKIWYNAFLYNPEGSPIREMTKRMSDFFDKNFKDIEESLISDGNITNFVDSKLTAATKKIDTLKTKGAHSEVDPMQKQMTTEEKFNLALQIRSSRLINFRPTP